MRATCKRWCFEMEMAREEDSSRETASKTFWSSVFGEFLATMFLMYIVSSVSSIDSDFYVAVAYGLGAASLVHWTDGLLNPALTVALCSTGKLSMVKGLVFIVMEISGGVAGAALTYALTPEKRRQYLTLGDPTLAEDMSTIQGLFLEFILSFILTLAVYASKDRGRKCKGYDAAIAYGCAVIVCHLVGCSYTMCGFNPARSFGTAVVRAAASDLDKPQSEWESHWIFWIGPICGSLLAGVLYHFFFTQPCVEYDFFDDASPRFRRGEPEPETVL